MRLRLLWIILAFILLSGVVVGCGREATESPQGVLGRWRVVDRQGMDVPHSFFWFTMDYLEFRDDGSVWALIQWPPGSGSEIRLNKTAAYALLDEDQIEFVGSCRHQDPCAGVYTMALQDDTLRIFDAEGELELAWVAPPVAAPPPAAAGPSATPTPTVTP